MIFKRLAIITIFASSLFLPGSVVLYHLIALVGFCFLVKNREIYFLKDRFVLATLAFGVVATIASVISLELSPHGLRAVTKGKYFLAAPFVFYFFQTIKEQISIGDVRKTFLMGAALSTLIGVVGMALGTHLIFGEGYCLPYRNCGAFKNIMSYSYSMVLILAFATPKLSLSYFRDKKNWGELAAILFVGVGVVLSLSRGAIAGLILVITLNVISRFKIRAILMAGIGLLSLLTFFAMGRTILSELGVAESRLHRDSGDRLFQELDSPGNVKRIVSWYAALNAFRENPFFGVGYRNFEFLSKDLKKKYPIEISDVPGRDERAHNWTGNAHNNFLEVLSGTGIVGFSTFMIFLILVAKNIIALKIYRREYIIFFLVFFATGLVESTIVDAHEAIIIFLVLSCLFLERESGVKTNNPILK